MKTLTDLKATESHAPWTEPRGIIAAIHHELAPGCFLHIRLGQAGLTITAGEKTVGISVADLIRLAQNHEPTFTPAAAPARPTREPSAPVPRPLNTQPATRNT